MAAVITGIEPVFIHSFYPIGSTTLINNLVFRPYLLTADICRYRAFVYMPRFNLYRRVYVKANVFYSFDESQNKIVRFTSGQPDRIYFRLEGAMYKA